MWIKIILTGGLVLLVTGVNAAKLPDAVAPVAPSTPQPAELIQVRSQKTQGLPETIQQLLESRKIPADNLSVYIRDLGADAPLVRHNATVPRNPASTMKLVTTWTALKLLGPSYTWKTEAWARGKIQDGTIYGDLILKGYGDPFLTDEPFWQLLHDLRLQGIQAIQGNLVVDNSYFSLPPQDPGSFDGDADRVYNAIPSALMFNFQASRVLFEPDEANHQVRLSSFPQTPQLHWDNRLKLLAGSCQRRHYNPRLDKQGNVVVADGNYAVGCGQQFVMRVLSSPEEHVFNAFRDVWLSMGGRFGGEWRTGTVQPGDVLLQRHESRTLGEQIRFINKWSNNVMARSVFLTVGAQVLGEPGTLDKARLATAEVLRRNGIDYQGMVIENGSGLSRQARISALQLGQLLETAWRDPYMPEFMASLPLLGEDGTLSGRFSKEDLRGRSHLKTGTLKDATAIAGYMLTRSGKRLVIVLQHNGPEAQGGGRQVQDALLRWAFEQ